MRETRTDIMKGTFWNFYSAVRSTAYTPANIKAAFRKTGIHPFNPDAVLTQVPPYSGTVSSPSKHLTILKTPHNRRDLRQQIHLAIDILQRVDTSSAIAALRRFAHTAETALATVEIKSIEAEDIRKRYQGKTTAKTDRQTGHQ
ncbi:hypothetical protein K440DRAFT_678725 [Wilcoxina mikolae CBS 423.85]|nr:hypothetical protein K440DRAFT_678725 [Wilcoxina mikolae CBS 423.85]